MGARTPHSTPLISGTFGASAPKDSGISEISRCDSASEPILHVLKLQITADVTRVRPNASQLPFAGHIPNLLHRMDFPHREPARLPAFVVGGRKMFVIKRELFHDEDLRVVVGQFPQGLD
jgi:hypothetical protein